MEEIHQTSFKDLKDTQMIVRLVLFSPCESVCVSSSQNMGKPTAAKTTTEVVLNKLTDVCVSI